MDYREIFDRAFSGIYRTYHSSDDREFCGAITERAKNMKNENENVRVGTLTEIEVPHYEKKHHGALGAAAGAVLAAAAIAGTVFGLNTYGGLKENVKASSTGAAYHADMDAPVHAVNGVVPMDESYAVDDAVVHFTGYEYDSVYAKLYYEVIYSEDTVLDKYAVPPTLSPVHPYTALIDPGCEWYGSWMQTSVVDEEHPNVQKITAELFRNEPSAKADIRFVRDDGGEKNSTDILFEIPVATDPDSLIEIHERFKFYVNWDEGQSDRTIFKDMYVTPTHAVAVFDNGYDLSEKAYGNIGLGIEGNDGEIKLAHDEGSRMKTGYANELMLMYWDFEEPIDLTQIKNININSAGMTKYGEQYNHQYLYGEIYEENMKQKADADELYSLEHSPLFTPADVWFEYEHCRAHVTGYTFDGLSARIRYEVYHDEPVDLRNDHGYCSICNPNTFTSDTVICSGGSVDNDRELEGLIINTYSLQVDEPTDEITIPFCSKWGSDTEKEMTKDYTFTLKYKSDVPRITRECDTTLEFDWGDTVHFDRILLTPGNISIRLSGSPYGDNYSSETGRMYMQKISGFKPVITFRDGRTLTLMNNASYDSTAIEPCGIPMPGGKASMFWQLRDTIDIYDVDTISVDGVVIYSADEDEETEEDAAEETTADEEEAPEETTADEEEAPEETTANEDEAPDVTTVTAEWDGDDIPEETMVSAEETDVSEETTNEE